MTRRALPNLAVFALIACVTSPACESSNSPAVYPVKGQVFVRNQPADGAVVILRPAASADPAEWAAGFPRAIAEADGSFQVSTYGTDDGAPAGSYVVLVQWNKAEGAQPADPETEVPDRLGGRYMNPETSTLRATVTEGPTELPRFNLE